MLLVNDAVISVKVLSRQQPEVKINFSIIKSKQSLIVLYYDYFF
jgi:hypothetical protein